MALCFTAIACTDRAAETRQQSLAFVGDWFDKAGEGAQNEDLCHGIGLLKHPGVDCAQMLGAAAEIDPTTRSVETIRPQDCFSGVCGEFIEIRFDSRDLSGNEIRETALLKRDDGQFRMYWYRSDSLLARLRADNPIEADEKEPEQLAYDEIIARYPSLYAYPPCYGVRVSSSNLAGDLMPKDAMDVAEIERLAATCPELFCFGLVGQKIAPICPKQPR